MTKNSQHHPHPDNKQPAEGESAPQSPQTPDQAPAPFASAEEIRGRAPTMDDGGDQLAADLERLQQERDSLFERLARVSADFENARKRIEADKLQQIEYGNSKLIMSLLPVIDNFERGLEADAAATDVASLIKGMRIVYDQLIGVLKAQHVEAIAPQPGTPFDPNLHQALFQQADAKYTEPTVTQVLRKGYTMRDRLLRAAQVAVSKAEEK